MNTSTAPGLKVYEGDLAAGEFRFAIVASRFNELVVRGLIDGAVDALLRHGARQDTIMLVRVPGALEIPQAAQHVARHLAPDAIICLGAVIRGATAHFEYVAGQMAAGVAAVAHATGIPVIMGVLTTDTLEQALERAGAKLGNKGAEAAMAAIEMASLVHKIQAR